MFDREQLFKVLVALRREEIPFLVAQDAFTVIESCIEQLDSIDESLHSFKYQMEDTLRADPNDRRVDECYRKCVELQPLAPALKLRLAPLADAAIKFWHCAPCDCSRRSSDAALQLWRSYNDGAMIGEAHLKLINDFKLLVDAVLASDFPDLVERLRVEEDLERQVAAEVQANAFFPRFSNVLPLSAIETFRRTNNSFIGASKYPMTHYACVDPPFSALLGYSAARILCFPTKSYMVNDWERSSLTECLMRYYGGKEKVLVAFYRTAKRDIVAVHWEVCTQALGLAQYAVGFEITEELEKSQSRQVGNLQKMLRQWLHSIRNASFEQQALVLLEEIRNLQSTLETDAHNAQIGNIVDGLKMLIHTAKTSVGLIDQALDTKGLVQQMSVADFVSNLTKFPHNFAESEGIGSIYVKLDVFFNDRKAVVADLERLFVKCDVIGLQALVDHVLSDAVRHTDPLQGIEMSLKILENDGILYFKLKVRDFCNTGLSDIALATYVKALGPYKAVDERPNTLPERLAPTATPVAADADALPVPPFAASASSALSNQQHQDGGTDTEKCGDGSGLSSSESSPVITDRMSSVDALSAADVSGVPRRPPTVPVPPPPLPAAIGGGSSGNSMSNWTPSVGTRTSSSHASSGTQSAGPSVSGVGSSGIGGIPHLAELYEQLVQTSGDFKMTIHTTWTGTTYRIRFNANVITPMSSYENVDRSIGVSKLIKGKLLVVDDSPVIRRILGKYLSNLSCKYQLCCDGEEALAWFQDNHDDCAAIITDLEMPRIGGDALISSAKAVNPFLPCFIVSGNEIPFLRLPTGTRRAIVKPITAECIQSVVEEIYAVQQEREAEVQALAAAEAAAASGACDDIDGDNEEEDEEDLDIGNIVLDDMSAPQTPASPYLEGTRRLT